MKLLPYGGRRRGLVDGGRQRIRKRTRGWDHALEVALGE
jgi:hypothetical protein